jgi:NAD(P)-dependent dehydrogenase (short-subunit alcohol dehydrogenase family)
MTRSVALVAGVGAELGLGAAIARAFAKHGHHAIAAGRTAAKVERVAASIRAAGGSAEALVLDVTDESAVVGAFAGIEAAHPGGLDAVLYNAGNNRPAPLRDTSVAHFEELWRVACLGGFIVGREAARALAPRGRGTIVFTGASASLRGKANFAAFAAAKAGIRAVAQSMAREFGSQGVHVAHVIVDGVIDGEIIHTRFPQAVDRLGRDGLLNVDDIAANHWHLHSQPRSAWTHEIDLRPFKERW